MSSVFYTQFSIIFELGLQNIVLRLAHSELCSLALRTMAPQQQQRVNLIWYKATEWLLRKCGVSIVCIIIIIIRVSSRFGQWLEHSELLQFYNATRELHSATAAMQVFLFAFRSVCLHRQQPLGVLIKSRDPRSRRGVWWWWWSGDLVSC